MNNRFPNIESFNGFLAPSRVECDIAHLEVEGKLPSFSGAFYRMQPDPMFPPRAGDDLFINGDGLVTMFRFERGRVDFRSRYVRTEKLCAELANGGALFGAYRNSFTDAESVRGLSRGTANTNVVFHGDRLLTLKEDSRPVEIEPETLKTLGSYNFNSCLKSMTFTAHPKVDPVSGEMFFFGCVENNKMNPLMTVGCVDSSGVLCWEYTFSVPYAGMVHDFAVTKEHIIFPIMPTIFDENRMKAGGVAFSWDGTKDMWVGIMSRTGDVRSMRWFRGASRWAFHIVNAFTKNGCVFVDACVSRAQPIRAFGDIRGKDWSPSDAVTRLSRWIFNLNKPTEEFKEEKLLPFFCDLPRIDERFSMTKHKYVFFPYNDNSKPLPMTRSEMGIVFNSIGRFDTLTRRFDGYNFDAMSAAQEPCFVARSSNAPEGDGYLLSVINRYDQNRSDLVVFDTATLSAGPIARVRMPIRLRNGIHGNWVGSVL